MQTEISLKDIFLQIKKNLIPIAIFTECVLIVASLYAFLFTKEQYTSSVLFTALITSDDGSANLSSSEISKYTQLVNDYSAIVNNGRSVKSAAAERLGLSSLSGYKISISSAGSSSREMTISVTGPSAYMTANIANSLFLKLKSEANRLFGIEKISVIDPAIVPTKPSAPNREQIILLATVIGLFAAIAFFVIKDIFDVTIKTAEDVEKEIGLPVLSQIPRAVNDPDSVKGKLGGNNNKKKESKPRLM